MIVLPIDATSKIPSAPTGDRVHATITTEPPFSPRPQTGASPTAVDAP
jgi:hypothetical protein